MSYYSPYQIPNRYQYQQRQFYHNPPQSPLLRSPINNRTLNGRFIQSANLPQSNGQLPVRLETYKVANKHDRRIADKVNIPEYSHSKQVKGNYVNEQKQFTPLTFRNQLNLPQEQIKHNSYAKETLQIVLLGFLILILILGGMYSLILWDKLKDAQGSNNSGIIVANGTLAGSVSVSEVKKQTLVSNQVSIQEQQEWTKLPDDEHSPLEFLQLGLIPTHLTDKTFFKQTSLINSQNQDSHSRTSTNFIHVRRHID